MTEILGWGQNRFFNLKISKKFDVKKIGFSTHPNISAIFDLFAKISTKSC
jgi:hypothetical protein